MSKNIIITGTSRGIGFELVQLFAKAGHQVLALSRNEKPIQNLRLDNVTCFSFDLNDSDAYQKVKHFVNKEWKHIDVLINNAGALLNKPFSETSMEDFENVYQTNVFGVAELTRIIIPFTKKK